MGCCSGRHKNGLQYTFLEPKAFLNHALGRGWAYLERRRQVKFCKKVCIECKTYFLMPVWFTRCHASLRMLLSSYLGKYFLFKNYFNILPERNLNIYQEVCLSNGFMCTIKCASMFRNWNRHSELSIITRFNSKSSVSYHSSGIFPY